jgi:hypothetical protein
VQYHWQQHVSRKFKADTDLLESSSGVNKKIIFFSKTYLQDTLSDSLLGFCTAWMRSVLSEFQRYMLPTFSGSKWVEWLSVCVGYFCNTTAGEGRGNGGCWFLVDRKKSNCSFGSHGVHQETIRNWCSWALCSASNNLYVHEHSSLCSLLPWRWRQRVSLKHQQQCPHPHGAAPKSKISINNHLKDQKPVKMPQLLQMQ